MPATANTDPPGRSCSWCGNRGRFDGYWLRCPVSGHPSSHHPGRTGPYWTIRRLVPGL